MRLPARRSWLAWALSSAVFIFGIFAFQRGLPPPRSPRPSLGEGPLTTSVSAHWAAKDGIAERALEGAVEPLPDPVPPAPDEVDPARKGLPPAPPGSPGNRWTVAKGDRLWTIAEKTLGAGRRFEEIVALNPGLEPGRLIPGMVLRLPPAAEITGNEIQPPAPASRRRYHVVASGENLTSIAQKYYSRPAWKLIYEANGDRLSSPDRLREGLRLIIPEAGSPSGGGR